MDEVYRTVYVEFTRPTYFSSLSWIIRLFEGTKYSHVRLRWVNNAGLSIIYEASGISVKFLGPEAQREKHSEVIHSYSIGVDFVQYKKTLDLCMRNAGISYGFKQLLGIGLVRIFGLNKNPLSNGRKSQVCSEIVGRFLQEILDRGYNLNLDTASPKDIQLIMDQYPYFRKKVNNER
jgi:hypothetical protein